MKTKRKKKRASKSKHDRLFEKYMAQVRETQEMIRESSRMTGADMGLRVGNANPARAARRRKGKDL